MPRLKPRVGDRREVIRVLAAMDDDEYQHVLDEARGHALIPLAHLVIEGLAESIDELAGKLSDGAVVVDDVGRRSTTRDIARQLFEDRAKRQAAARERAARVEAQRAETAARHNEQVRADRERMRLIGELQEKNGGGLLREDDTW